MYGVRITGGYRNATTAYLDRIPFSTMYTDHSLAPASARATAVEIEAEYNPSRRRTSMTFPPDCGVQEDGSLNDGIEITTPPVAGAMMVEYITKVCEKLKRYEFEARPSCGLHVHIDMRDRTGNPQYLSRLFNTFYTFENLLYAMQSENRYNGNYSIPLRHDYKFYEMYGQEADKFDFNYYRQAKTEIGQSYMQNSKSHKYDSSRYAAFNFHSVYFRGSLEVRLHQGSLKPTEIVNWIRILQKIVERVDKGMERQHPYRFMAKWVKEPANEAKFKAFCKYFHLEDYLRTYMKARIETGQGFGFDLPYSVNWGEAKRGRPIKIKKLDARVSGALECRQCGHNLGRMHHVDRYAQRYCPGCGVMRIREYDGGIRWASVRASRTRTGLRRRPLTAPRISPLTAARQAYWPPASEAEEYEVAPVPDFSSLFAQTVVDTVDANTNINFEYFTLNHSTNAE